MTTGLEQVYHAGDLIGYNKNGQPIYLPGGGARDGAIVVDDRDDDELDDELDDDEPDDDDDDDDDEEPPAPAKRSKPSYAELLEQLKKLQAGQQRNNKELAKRRITGQWMEKHGIDDLDAWLAERGIDKETGQGQAPPAPAPEGIQNPPPVAPVAPAAPPASENNPPALDEAEVNRRVQLELEKRNAREAERAQVLEESLRSSAIEAALKGLGFAGTVEKAMLLIDKAAITVGDDGTVTGAAEAAQELREEIPEWFRRRAPVAPPRPGGERMDGGDKRPAPPPKKRWDEQVVEAWRTGRGR